jgi:hypothetical protein
MNTAGIISRRTFIKTGALLGAGLYAAVNSDFALSASKNNRRFHASLSIDALERYPDLLPTVVNAGVDAVWVAAFLQGIWQYPPETVGVWKKRIEAAGLEVHHITVPLGHPSFTEAAPDYMGELSYQPWQRGILPDGRACYGVCIHPPACDVNAEGVKILHDAAPGMIFLDDDFRLAPSPHDIGGCFCPAHKAAFLEKHGYSENTWEEMLAAVKDRRLTAPLRNWLEDACTELSGCFKAQQAMLPEKSLGIMVMYMGSEKAGIRLDDYRDVPFRVGELQFNDQAFSRVKGKTDELFSVLFHRRFTLPENSYSESTAWPPDGLSPENLAAKLAISTIADVRNTMLMSGLEPYPLFYWDTLAPAMKKHRALHETLAGHKPTGPLKHYWGDAGRWVGDSKPYSLFLATGVPFEVTEIPADDGFTFLGDGDAKALQDGRLKPGKGLCITREKAEAPADVLRYIPEELDALFAFKRELLEKNRDFPYVVEDLPVICAWYPTANLAALWNLSENAQPLTLAYQGREYRVNASGLELVPVPLNA